MLFIKNILCTEFILLLFYYKYRLIECLFNKNTYWRQKNIIWQYHTFFRITNGILYIKAIKARKERTIRLAIKYWMAMYYYASKLNEASCSGCNVKVRKYAYFLKYDYLIIKTCLIYIEIKYSYTVQSILYSVHYQFPVYWFVVCCIDPF